MKNKLHIIGFHTTDGMFQPIATSKSRLSVKKLRRLISPFNDEKDFERAGQMSWSRLYNSPKDAMNELPCISM